MVFIKLSGLGRGSNVCPAITCCHLFFVLPAGRGANLCGLPERYFPDIVTHPELSDLYRNDLFYRRSRHANTKLVQINVFIGHANDMKA
jgi:hypothetical protein